MCEALMVRLTCRPDTVLESHRSGQVVQDPAGQEDCHHHRHSDQEVEPPTHVPSSDNDCDQSGNQTFVTLS